MDTVIKQMWLDALRSGEFKQAQGALCRVDEQTGERSYCCLGVLSEIAVREGIIPEGTVEADSILNQGNVGYDPQPGFQGKTYYEYSLLPQTVQEWAGLSSYGNSVNVDGVDDDYNSLDLPEKNDAGHSFTEIADLIEKSL